jgi:hypothetical protein
MVWDGVCTHWMMVLDILDDGLHETDHHVGTAIITVPFKKKPYAMQSADRPAHTEQG